MEARRNKLGEITSYREKVYINNKAVLSPAFKNKTDAKIWKSRISTDKHKQLATGVSYNTKITFKEFATKWLEEKIKVRNAERTYEAYSGELNNHLFPIIGNIPIGEINLTHFNKIVALLKDKALSSRTINNVLTNLKAVLNTAVRWDYLPRNALHGAQQLKENPNTFKYWTKTEILQFLRANLHNEYYPLFTFALNTGMRKGELLGLCWDRIDMQRGLVDITRIYGRKHTLQERTKTYERRIIPLNYDAKNILMQLFKSKQHNTPFVFTRGDGSRIDYNHIGREFLKAQKQAGLINIIRFHDTRHTFASQFMMHEGNIFTLQKLLGHKSIDMTMKYAHLANDYLKDAINVMSFSGNGEVFSPNLAPSPERALKVVDF